MRRHQRLASRLLLAVMTISVALSASLYAQSTQLQPNQAGQNQSEQNQSQQAAGEQAQNQTESASGDAAAQDTAEPLPDIDSQPIEPGARSNGRFIPSEQISQDLGVSFPVDI